MSFKIVSENYIMILFSGDPDDLVATGTKSNPLEDWRDLKHLCLLNLTYDFTPANLVGYVILFDGIMFYMLNKD